MKQTPHFIKSHLIMQAIMEPISQHAGRRHRAPPFLDDACVILHCFVYAMLEALAYIRMQ